MLFLRSFLVVAFGVLFFLGCSKEEVAEDNFPRLQPTDPLVLVQENLRELEEEDGDERAPELRTGNLRKRANQVFGAISGPSLRRFVEDRVSKFVVPDSSFSIQPREMKHRGWLKKKPKVPPLAPSPDPVRSPRQMPDDVMAAYLNVQYWFQGLMDGTKYVLHFRGNTYPIDRPDKGVVLLGPAIYRYRHLRTKAGVCIPRLSPRNHPS